MWDYFISYASEDRERIVRPLVSVLKAIGLTVWYDRFELRAGDSLFRRIQEGIASARHGIVVISPPFLQKKWPHAELAAMFAAEELGSERILPVWHKVSPTDLSKQVPILADRVGISSDQGLLNVAAEIVRATALDKLHRLRALGLDDFGGSQRFHFSRHHWNDAHIPEEWTHEGWEVANALLDADGTRNHFATLLSAYPTLLLDMLNLRYASVNSMNDLQIHWAVTAGFEFMVTPYAPWPTTGPWGHDLVYLGPTKARGHKTRLSLASDILDTDLPELISIVAAAGLGHGESSSVEENPQTSVLRSTDGKPPISVLFEPGKCRWVHPNVKLSGWATITEKL